MRGFRGALVCAAILMIGAMPPSRAAEDATPNANAYRAQYDGPPDGGYGPPPGYGAGRYGAPDEPAPSRRGGAFVSYHGFKLDLARAGDAAGMSSAVASAEHQVDIVDRAGLGEGALRLFRSLPIRVSAGGFGPGHFSGGREVTIAPAVTADDRPILLHEYMHAYEFFRMPGGFHNPEVVRFYNEAMNGGLYESGSYMMSNPAEFFAVTASCYLNGTVAREPYTRDAIRAKQPEYYAFLGRLFGHAGE